MLHYSLPRHGGQRYHHLVQHPAIPAGGAQRLGLNDMILVLTHDAFPSARQSGIRNPSSHKSHKDYRRRTCAYVHGKAHRPAGIVFAWRQSLRPIQRGFHRSFSMLVEIGWKLRVLRAMELYNVGVEGAGKMATAAIDSILAFANLAKPS